MTTDGPRGVPTPSGPDAARSPPDATLSLGGPIERADIAAFCERARPLIQRSVADPVVCDLGRIEHPDAVTLEALARLQLEAGRLGRRLVFRDACGELRELVSFAGLDGALPCEEP